MTLIPWWLQINRARLAPSNALGFHPVANSPNNQALATRLNEWYDTRMYSQFDDEFYDVSGFHNFGYWTPQTRNAREASENLVDRLLDFLPYKKTGIILDVACGKGWLRC